LNVGVSDVREGGERKAVTPARPLKVSRALRTPRHIADHAEGHLPCASPDLDLECRRAVLAIGHLKAPLVLEGSWWPSAWSLPRSSAWATRPASVPRLVSRPLATGTSCVRSPWLPALCRRSAPASLRDSSALVGELPLLLPESGPLLLDGMVTGSLPLRYPAATRHRTERTAGARLAAGRPRGRRRRYVRCLKSYLAREV
jgi:hypothetical protein